MKTTNTLAALLLLVLPVVGQDEPEEQPDNDALCRAICRAQDLGKLTPLEAVAKLAGSNESVARTVAAIVRHQWAELSQDFFTYLTANPKAAYRFLEELARAPRPAAEQWVREQSVARPNRSLNHRLLAFAALGKPLGKPEALVLLEALRNKQVDDGAYFAAPLLPKKVADGMLGRLHQGLMQGDITVADAGPLLDRLSARGIKSLIGLAVSLPQATARGLMRYVFEVRPKLVQERVAAALDGRVPLDPLLLGFASKLLTSQERIDRVVAVLRDGESIEERGIAFEVLLLAQAIDETVLELAIDDESVIELSRIIIMASTKLPASYVVDWLVHSPDVALAMSRALVLRPQLEEVVQKQLLDILDGLGAADSHTPLYAVTALVQGGNAQSLKVVWPLVINSVAWRDLLNRLGRRTEPFVYEIILTELQSEANQKAPDSDAAEMLRQCKLDVLRLLLVSQGDRRELDTLVKNAPNRDSNFVRKCRQYATKLSDVQVQSLFDAALVAGDPDVASELLEWVVAVQPDAIGERLWLLWSQPPEVEAVEELLEVAMRLLVTGQKREPLLAQLRDAMAKGALPDKLSSLPYEALNSMAEPLHVSDLTLCAEMVLKMPLEDAEGEQRRIKRWPDGTVGFPLISAIGSRLRTADPVIVEQVFATMVEELQGDPRCSNISRQRLKVFWRSLAFNPELQRLIGHLTSQLWVFHDGDDPVSDGAAIWLQALHSEHEGNFGQAERLYSQAIRELLRLPSSRGEARWLLGDRDTAGGDDPVAQLSASPYRMRLLAAKKAGDQQAITIASNLVREFAGHDRETLATLSSTAVGGTPVESGR
ncbi:MAG: hypothetical protein ACI91B_000625 [Planctomycetota bacterium]|jgi:hypothetical protein